MARASRASQSRASESRESGMRKRPETHFQSKLYVPKDKIPANMTYAWVRESTLNEPDPDNMTDRMIKGWAPVPASRHPEMVPPLMTVSKIAIWKTLKLCRMWHGLVRMTRTSRVLKTKIAAYRSSALHRLRINLRPQCTDTRCGNFPCPGNWVGVFLCC